MANTNLSPLDEVRADARYNHMRRIELERQDREYQASKQAPEVKAEPESEAKKGK